MNLTETERESNGNLIFSQTFDTLAMKKNFILNFANNEKKLFFGQASKIAQKSLVTGTTMPSGLKIPTRGNLWRIINNYAVMDYGY